MAKVKKNDVGCPVGGRISYANGKKVPINLKNMNKTRA